MRKHQRVVLEGGGRKIRCMKEGHRRPAIDWEVGTIDCCDTIALVVGKDGKHVDRGS